MAKLAVFVALAITVFSVDALHIRKTRQPPDWETYQRCSKHLNFVEKCNPQEYTVLMSLASSRNPKQAKDIVDNAGIVALCGEVVPLLECGQNMMKNIPSDCQGSIANPFASYDEIIEMSDGFIDIVKDTCENDVDLIIRNEQCFIDEALGEKISRNCEPDYRAHPCKQFEESLQCIKEEMYEDPVCSDEATDFLTGKARDIYNLFKDKMCHNTPGGYDILEKVVKLRNFFKR
jgi:hypothetical protein